jgi:hypothetical protein
MRLIGVDGTREAKNHANKLKGQHPLYPIKRVQHAPHTLDKCFNLASPPRPNRNRVYQSPEFAYARILTGENASTVLISASAASERIERPQESGVLDLRRRAW